MAWCSPSGTAMPRWMPSPHPVATKTLRSLGKREGDYVACKHGANAGPPIRTELLGVWPDTGVRNAVHDWSGCLRLLRLR